MRPAGDPAMPAAQARRIARAFIGGRFDRYHYYYGIGKLRTDPLYPAVVDALRGCQAPVLDIGCGLGLLAHVLRDAGIDVAYLGLDVDAGKIGRAIDAADRAGLSQVRYVAGDAGQPLPPHAGSVALLDVLQYLTPQAQDGLLQAAAERLTPGARLVIRSGIDGPGARSRITIATDRIANAIGWMTAPVQFPTLAWFDERLAALDLSVRKRPLYGRTPFNNWLIIATRGA